MEDNLLFILAATSEVESEVKSEVKTEVKSEMESEVKSGSHGHQDIMADDKKQSYHIGER